MLVLSYLERLKSSQAIAFSFRNQPAERVTDNKRLLVDYCTYLAKRNVEACLLFVNSQSCHKKKQSIIGTQLDSAKHQPGGQAETGWVITPANTINSANSSLTDVVDLRTRKCANENVD